MSLRCYEWRVGGRGQTTCKPSIHKALSTVYKIARATWKKTAKGWKIIFCKMKGLIVHPIIWDQFCGLLKIPIGFTKFPMEFPTWELKEPLKSHTIALKQLVKFHFISRMVIKRGLELIASTLSSTFWKEELGVRTPSPWHHLLHKSFQWRTSFLNFHPRFVNERRWRFHPTWSFWSSTRGEEKPEVGAT